MTRPWLAYSWTALLAMKMGVGGDGRGSALRRSRSPRRGPGCRETGCGRSRWAAGRRGRWSDRASRLAGVATAAAKVASLPLARSMTSVRPSGVVGAVPGVAWDCGVPPVTGMAPVAGEVRGAGGVSGDAGEVVTAGVTDGVERGVAGRVWEGACGAVDCGVGPGGLGDGAAGAEGRADGFAEGAGVCP